MPAGIIGLGLLLASGARAQLSPGPLSRPHGALEGLKKCSQCHALGTREVTDRCLDCHKEIAAMRAGGPGLHRDAAYARCADCHVEHQGVDFDLIYWQGGRDHFDHAVTGFTLAGRHATLDCRQCHKASLVKEGRRALLKAGKRLDRTWLGLATACTACHDDPHTGQFARACTDCHDATAWKPAARFDHARTPFPLTGRHQSVACDSCHTLQIANPPAQPHRRYAKVPATSCTDCHRDVHKGALGPHCSECHVTDGWRRIQGKNFDHDRTRYPLRGRHVGVDCNGCHGHDRRRPAFDHCSACHRDEHDAVARGRPDLRQCEPCHTVAGYAPASFTLERHQQSGYPLRGAHLAVACNACHRSLPGRKAVDLLPVHAACTDCHEDPHGGQTRKIAGVAGCASCHREDAWNQVAFAHVDVGFPLTGRHAQIACRQCHPRGDGPVWSLRAQAGLRDCAACHQDIHDRQFAREDGRTACDRCHVTVDWLAEKFDHDRDSRFALRGGHERVACTACHARREPGHALTFKPLATTCTACHGATVPRAKESP